MAKWLEVDGCCRWTGELCGVGLMVVGGLCWCGVGMWCLRRSRLVALRMWRVKALVMPRPNCCKVWICGVGAVWEYP